MSTSKRRESKPADHAPPAKAARKDVAQAAEDTVAQLAALAEAHEAAPDPAGAGRRPSAADQLRLEMAIRKLVDTPARAATVPPNAVTPDAKVQEVVHAIESDKRYLLRGTGDDQIHLNVHTTKKGNPMMTLTMARLGEDGVCTVEPLRFVTPVVVNRFLRLFPYGNRAVDYRHQPAAKYLGKTLRELRYEGMISGQCWRSPAPDDVGMEASFRDLMELDERLRRRVAQLVWDDPVMNKLLRPFWVAQLKQEVAARIADIQMLKNRNVQLNDEEEQLLAQQTSYAPTESELRRRFLEEGVITPLTSTCKTKDDGGPSVTYRNIRIGGAVLNRVFNRQVHDRARTAALASNDPLARMALNFVDFEGSLGYALQDVALHVHPRWDIPIKDRAVRRAVLDTADAHLMAHLLHVDISCGEKTQKLGKVRLNYSPETCWWVGPFSASQTGTSASHCNPLAAISSGDASQNEATANPLVSTDEDDELLLRAMELHEGAAAGRIQ